MSVSEQTPPCKQVRVENCNKSYDTKAVNVSTLCRNKLLWHLGTTVKGYNSSFLSEPFSLMQAAMLTCFVSLRIESGIFVVFG